jgi:hypothetical protein
MSKVKVNQNTETKTKLISLTIGDLIAVILFTISLGTSIGFYAKNMDDLKTIKEIYERTRDKIEDINSNCTSISTSIEFLKNDITTMKADIKELNRKN